MSEQKPMPRGRTFLAGKVISNYGQSTIDCTVRRISDTGAVIEVESVLGVPEHFHLMIPGEGDPQPCKRSWQSEKQIGLVFETVEAVKAKGARPIPTKRRAPIRSCAARCWRCVRRSTSWMSACLLLDANLKSQFINRAFRRMWALPDAVADRNPAFVALMYHGRDTRAYEIRLPRSTPTSPTAFAWSRKATPRRSICAAPMATWSACNAPNCRTAAG